MDAHLSKITNPGLNPKGVVLRGSSKQETSSKEVIQHAKDERERRRLAKEQPLAAIKIQKTWRAREARKTAQSALKSEWIKRYATLVARQDATVSPQELTEHVLPLLLAINLPPPGAQRTSLQQGASLAHTNADPVDTACVRGSLYLLLKSLTATDPKDSMIFKGEAQLEAQLEGISENDSVLESNADSALISQLRRTATLCCAVIGVDGIDGLTQSASARILALLTSENVAGAETGRHFQRWLATLPMVAYAARRLVVALESKSLSVDESTRKLLAYGVGNIILAQVNLVGGRSIVGSSNTNSSSRGRTCDINKEALVYLVDIVLTTPGILKYLGTAARTDLGKPAMYCAAARCACERAPEMSAEDALYFFEVLAGRLNSDGEKTSSETCTASTPTEEREKTRIFGKTAQALLDRALERTSRSRGVLGAASLEAVARGFSEKGVIGNLHKALPLGQFCMLCSSVLQVIGSGSESATNGQINIANSTRVLSTLAFATPLLKELWPWLSRSIGLPLEVPSQATTWEISSLPQGIYSVPLEYVSPFTLFCRLHCHYLSVADDFEFHEGRGPFTLPQHRAIAASLVSLVFRTHIPITSVNKTSQAPIHSERPKRSSDSSFVELMNGARLLRALYERDVRRKFCPPELWLEPYRRLAASSGVDASGAAVLKALLRSQGQDEESEASSVQPVRPGSPPGRGTRTGGGQRRPMNNTTISSSSAQHAQHAPLPPFLLTQSVSSGLAALLLQAPQCIPFEERVAVFRGLVLLDKQSRGYHLAPIDGGPRPLRITIRRSRLLEDALAGLGPAGGVLRGPLSVTFISAQGREEAGVDMGGLTKELLEQVATEVTRPDRGLFTQTHEGGTLYPHPLATSQEGGAALLSLAGAVLGKALYEGILLQAPLAPFLVARLLGRLPTLDDLAALDPEVHRSLTFLKNYSGDASELGLDFTVESDAFGAKIIEELIPGGEAIEVTSSNKLQYIHLVADWHLRRRLGRGAAAFSRGIESVLPVAWLRLFSPKEVNELLGGGEGAEVNIEDMRRHVVYNGYSNGSRTIGLFWKVVEKMSQEERRALLRFVTASSRPPLGGFAHLKPPLTIQKVDCGVSPLALLGGKDVDRLPSASTCANTLKLPNYQRAATLREKLLYAIRSGAGFELS